MTLKTGYVDWTSVLPCDRAVAMPTQMSRPRPPYTEASARPAGWRWRIPLQHRAGNGYVYSSAHVSDTQAADDLLAEVGETPLAEPRLLRFVTGRRELFWNRNCVAIGLASGFLEPLESTSIHLAMSGVYKLLEHFPDKTFEPSNIAAYNDDLIADMERVRDFIVLHYSAAGRDDSPFWKDCRNMALPDSLLQRIATYRENGRIRIRQGELFTDLSWFYIFEGLGVEPRRTDPLMDILPRERLSDILATLARSTTAAAGAAPAHDSYFQAMSAQAETFGGVAVG